MGEALRPKNFTQLSHSVGAAQAKLGHLIKKTEQAMSDEKPNYDPDNNPELAKLTLTEAMVGNGKIAPKGPIKPREPIQKINYDPDGLENRNLFGGGVLR